MDIKLATITEKDLELIRNWRNSKDVSQYMYTDDVITRNQQEAWYEKIKKSETAKFWIIEYNEKKIGVASLNNIDQALDSCFWAFYLGDTSIRGVGIGGKVEFNVLSYVFEELKLNKLRCEVFVFNESVIRMHEKFGFRREAYYREHCRKSSKYLDVVGLAMLRSEWLVLKDKIYERVYRKTN